MIKNTVKTTPNSKPYAEIKDSEQYFNTLNIIVLPSIIKIFMPNRLNTAKYPNPFSSFGCIQPIQSKNSQILH